MALRAGAFDMLQAEESYDAVYGDQMTQLGLRFEWRPRAAWFWSLASDLGEVDGERVVLVPEPIPTGIETTLQLNPWQLSTGWIFGPQRTWSPYLGGGITYLRLEEESDLETVSESGTGAHVLLGMRFRAAPLVLAGEALYSSVPDILGDGGAAAVFDEDDAGGLALTLRAGWEF